MSGSAEHSVALGIVADFIKAGQAEGAIPLGRAPLTGDEHIKVTWSRDGVAACAVYYQPEGHDFYWLDILYVKPEERRQGHATCLLQMVEEEAQRAGLSSVQFGTMRSNDAMQKLAARHDFKPADRIDYVKQVTP
tara:strand:- start:971 stop:1375 length:405 start_codon:yes stop_codon:yes gene_type:complete